MAIKKAGKGSRVSRELSFKMEAVDGTVNAGQYEVFKITSPASFQDKVGMLVHNIQYQVNTLEAVFAADGDSLRFGLSFLAVSPATGFSFTTPGVIDYNRLERVDLGTAATGKYYIQPLIDKDMHRRHPDGMLIHPASLYWWYYVENTIADAFDIDCKVFYEDVEITQEDWDDLWKGIFVTQAG